MNNSVRTVLIVLGVLVLLGGAFLGGMAIQNAKNDGTANADAVGPGFNGQGGPMGAMTEEQRQELESMTEEERQQFFQEQMGSQGASGTVPPGSIGMPGGRGGGGLVEGEVLDVSDDAITLKIDSGNSQTVYIDDDTLVAKAEGAGDLAAGASVLVAATPEADGVSTASLIVVKP